jgi:hypothetical protein
MNLAPMAVNTLGRQPFPQLFHSPNRFCCTMLDGTKALHVHFTFNHISMSKLSIVYFIKFEQPVDENSKTTIAL